MSCSQFEIRMTSHYYHIIHNNTVNLHLHNFIRFWWWKFTYFIIASQQNAQWSFSHQIGIIELVHSRILKYIVYLDSTNYSFHLKSIKNAAQASAWFGLRCSVQLQRFAFFYISLCDLQSKVQWTAEHIQREVMREDEILLLFYVLFWLKFYWESTTNVECR